MLVGAERERVEVLLLVLSGVVDLVTLEVTDCEVLGDEVIVLKSVPTCVSVDVLLSACIADSELKIFSIIVVGFSVVLVSVRLAVLVRLGVVCFDVVVFLVANLRIAEPLVGSISVGVVTFGVRSGEDVVEMAVIELIILSIMDPGPFVVGAAVVAFASFSTFANRFCWFLLCLLISGCLVTAFEGMVGATEDDR